MPGGFQLADARWSADAGFTRAFAIGWAVDDRLGFALAIVAIGACNAILIRGASGFAGRGVALVIAACKRRGDAGAATIAGRALRHAIRTAWRCAIGAGHGKGARANARAYAGETTWFHGIGCASVIRRPCGELPTEAISAARLARAVTRFNAANVIDAMAGLALGGGGARRAECRFGLALPH